MAHAAGVVPHGFPAQILACVLVAPGPPAPARIPVPVLVDIRINGVGLFGLPGHIITEGSRIAGLLLGFLLQPRGVNLGLFRVSTGPARPGLLLAGIELHLLRLPAHFGSLFAVRLVTLLLHCPAATARHQECDQKNHHNNAHNYPNPGCNVQATHLFPSASAGPRATGLTDGSDPLIGHSFENNYQGYLCSISNHAYYFTASMAGS
ncbi:MAG: hypothetical protein JWR71_1683 [Pseudarthrobacter sp.]|nr:hypothetical protein [Pseudarthrobacter sp.]